MKPKKKTFRIVLMIVLIIIMLFWLVQMNWNNVFSKENSGAILGILAPLLILISLQMQHKESEK